jgi:hypothetical protein
MRYKEEPHKATANKKEATRVSFLCDNSPEGLLPPEKFIAGLSEITSR